MSFFEYRERSLMRRRMYGGFQVREKCEIIEKVRKNGTLKDKWKI